MLQELRQLASDPVLGFSLTVVGLALSVFGLYLARRYKPRLRLGVASWNNTDILSAVMLEGTSIQILDKGRPVAGLSQLWVTFKNNGTQVLKPEDFHQLPTIQFLGDVKILHAEIKPSAGHIQPDLVSKNVSELAARFKFLEPKDRLSIRVVYGSATPVNGMVTAKVVGGNQVRMEVPTNRHYDAYRESKLLGKTVYSFLAVGLFALGSQADKWIRAEYGLSEVPEFVTKTLIFVVAVALTLPIGLKIQREREAARVRQLIRQGYLDPAAKDDLLSPGP